MVRDSLGFALSQYLARLAVLLRGLAAAAALGPAGFGAWNVLNLILDYGAYASGGALQGLDLELPAMARRGERAAASRAASAAWSVALAGGAVFALGTAAVLSTGWVASTGWGWGPPLLTLAAVMIQIAIQYHGAALRAHGAFTAVSGGLALQAVVGAGIGIAGVWRWGVWALLWGWLVGGVTALAWMRRFADRPPLTPAGPGRGLALARRGAPLFWFFAVSVVLRSLDRLALVRFGGNDALGLYAVGLIVSGLVLYLPESVAAVLFPRIAAASGGARDPERTRAELIEAQRGLAVVLPFVVGVAVLWAPPLVSLLLPAFREGLGALRALAAGTLALAAATLPGYFLLGSGRGGRLLRLALAATALTAGLVFGAAVRDPRPATVGWAAAAGQAALALGILIAAADALGLRSRTSLVVSGLVPAAWASFAFLLLSRGGESFAGAAARSALFALAYLPVWLLFGRGLRLRVAPGETPP